MEKRAKQGVMRQGLQLALLLVVGIVIGFLLLMGAYLIPVESISRNVQLSVQALDGSWATGESAYEQLVKGYISTQLDNSTDANMLLAAAHESNQPLVQQAIDVATYSYNGHAYPALMEYGQNGSQNLYSSPVARYWLGFLIVLKPMLLLFSYMDIRMILMIAQLLLLGAVVAGLYKQKMGEFSPALMHALVVITPAVAGFSMQFSTVYMLMLLAMLVVLYRPGIASSRFRMARFVLLIGMATSYFDYLTYPIATFGMPFALAVLMNPPKSCKDACKMVVACVGAWLVGYFGMWGGKWLIATLFGTDHWFIPNLLAKITERSSLQVDAVQISFLDAIRAVVSVFAKKAYLALMACTILVFAVSVIKALYKRRKEVHIQTNKSQIGYASFYGQLLALGAAAALPIGWYLFTANHTYNHAFFTSRALVVTVFAGAAMAQLVLRKIKDRVVVGER